MHCWQLRSDLDPYLLDGTPFFPAWCFEVTLPTWRERFATFLKDHAKKTSPLAVRLELSIHRLQLWAFYQSVYPCPLCLMPMIIDQSTKVYSSLLNPRKNHKPFLIGQAITSLIFILCSFPPDSRETFGCKKMAANKCKHHGGISYLIQFPLLRFKRRLLFSK